MAYNPLQAMFLMVFLSGLFSNALHQEILSGSSEEAYRLQHKSVDNCRKEPWDMPVETCHLNRNSRSCMVRSSGSNNQPAAPAPMYPRF